MPSPKHATRGARLAIAIVVSVALAIALLAHPPIAFAGRYTVHTCQTPSGTWTGTAGWTSSASAPLQGQDPGIATSCAEQTRSLKLQFGTTHFAVTPTREVSWTFSAPVATQISSLSLHRSLHLGWPVVTGRYGRPYIYDVWHDDDDVDNQLEFELPPFNGDTGGIQFPPSLEAENVSWNSLTARLSCWGLVGSLDCGPFNAQVVISRAAIGLTDVDSPEGFASGGALAGDDPVRGVAGLSIHAIDDGGGVYRVALEIDGSEVARQVLDAAGGSCGDVEPANADPYEFGTARPCPLDADGSVQADTATLSDGTHTVRATVEDAAGNEAVVFDGTVETHNAPINAGVPTIAGQAAVAGQLAASAGQWEGAPTDYHHRWLRCDGDGANCVPVAGGTAPTLALTEADAYHRMRVEVTAANSSGAAAERSAPTALVADADGHTAPPPSSGGGGSGTGSGTGGGATAPGEIQGIENPLGALPGHIPNGNAVTARARIEAAFRRASGGTARSIRARHGRRLSIAGRLTNASGAGIDGARLGAAWRVAGRGWVARPGVRTGADGRFAYTLPSGPSRDVRFTYFPYSDSRAVVLSNVVHAEVSAPVTIRADRQRVTGTRVVRLSGHVGSGSIPRAGLLVTLQGFQKGWGWRVFRTVRTDRRGHWSTRYRFRLTTGRFGFRALVPHQGAFPFATGRSTAVYVVVA